MKKHILNYRTYIDSLLDSGQELDWNYIKREHLTQISFFQHERLVHLIVTVTFAVLELMAVIAYVMAGIMTTDCMLSIPLLILALMLLVLLVPYIKHYYLLENEVQKMYVQYDKIVEKAQSIPDEK